MTVRAVLLTAAVALMAATPATAQTDGGGGWTVEQGAALEGGDALYCDGPCDVFGVRNIQSSSRLDIAAGNSDPNAGAIVHGSIAYCWDITCTNTFYNGQGVPLVQITPTRTDFRAPTGRLLMRLSDRGIVFYEQPHFRGGRRTP